jgi:anti-sigma-K factor RskA
MADENTIPNDDIAALIRSVGEQDHLLETPPLSVWSGIEREMALPAAMADGEATAGTSPPGSTARSRRRLLIGAAAVLLAVSATAGAVALRSTGSNVTTLAVARLSSDGLPGAPAGRMGSAHIVRHDGREFLRLDDGKVAARSGEYLELWLIDTKVEGMVSLGIVDGNGEFELPSGLRYADFPIVDISTEPYDGKPTHSGASLLRGSLV